jgi:short-chain fatty acids transporter
LALAKRVKNVDYRLLIASAYSGFLVWHAGLSGSIPLQIATAGPDIARLTNNALVDPVSTSLTIFAPFNLIIALVIIATLPLLHMAMHPEAERTVTVDPELIKDEEIIEMKREDMTPADKLENSVILSMLIGLMGLGLMFL